jgi:tetratricopeptide (TPR) repeat protein
MFLTAAPHHASRPRFRHTQGSGVNPRRWLAAGICGALFVVALSSLWDVWVINTAGILVNRAIVQGDVAEGSSTEKDLTKAMDLMEEAAGRGPHTAAREIPIWRTYGAAAALTPTTHAFELLVRSRNAGRLDRIGELWLGEVASATQQWEEAERAYMRVDASNLLIHRAETYLQSGDKDLALLQFGLAKKSLDAAMERATAEELLLDRTGNRPSVTSRLMQRPGERATSLYQIGRGVMNAGDPTTAVAILEEALETAETDSPGIVTQQSITLGLSLALAKTLPTVSALDSAGKQTYFDLDPSVAAEVRALVRIRALAYEAVRLDVTAAACVQAGRVLLLAGDDSQAVVYLERALDLDPRLPETYLVLGQRYEDRGMIILARELYREGVEMLPANEGLAGAYAIAVYKSRTVYEALPLLEHAADMPTRDPYVFAFLGDCYADLGLISQARATYFEGLRKSPGSQVLIERLTALNNTQSALP